jgi:monoamine oxidase
LASKLQKKIHFVMDSVVLSVRQTEDSVFLTTQSGSSVLEANKAIFCLPPSQLVKLSWQPMLPPLRAACIQTAPMGHLLTFAISFNEADWRLLHSNSGTILSSGGRRTSGCGGGPFSAIQTLRHRSGQRVLRGCLGGRLAAEWTTMAPGKVEEEILNRLSELLGGWVHQRTEILLKDWGAEEHVGGGFTYAAPGSMHAWPTLRMPFQNVHFGGAETALAGIGFIEGAVQAGSRAALEVLQLLRPQCLSSEEHQVTIIHSGGHINQPAIKPWHNISRFSNQ